MTNMKGKKWEPHWTKMIMDLSLVPQILKWKFHSSQTSSDHSSATSIRSKRADTEADLVAKQAQSKAIKEIQEQQAHVHKLENDWKLKQANMLSEIKQKEVEIELKLEEKKRKLLQLQAEVFEVLIGGTNEPFA